MSAGGFLYLVTASPGMKTSGQNVFSHLDRSRLLALDGISSASSKLELNELVLVSWNNQCREDLECE